LKKKSLVSALVLLLLGGLTACSLLYPNAPISSPTSAVGILPTKTASATSAAVDEPETNVTQGEVTSPNLVRIEMLDEFTGWGVSDRAVLRTQDGGVSWTDVTPPGVDEMGYSSASYFLDAAVGWLLLPDQQDYRRGVLYSTSDSGSTWQTSIVPFGRSELNFVNDIAGWALFISGAGAGSSLAEIYQTTDGGQSWSLVFQNNPDRPDAPGSIPFSGSKNGISFRDESHGWVTGDLPAEGFVYLYFSQDGGVTWNQQPLELPAGFEQAFIGLLPPKFFSSDHGKLIMRFFRQESYTLVYTTNNGGKTWIPTTPIELIGQTEFSNMQSGIMWDGGEKLYGTMDGGMTWLTIHPNINIKDNLVQLDFVNSVWGWALAMNPDGSNTLYTTNDAGITWQPLP
jgi:photosystem II stability/assembly factor-like uncharacterized protein